MPEINPNGEEGASTPMNPANQPVPASGLPGAAGNKPAPDLPHTTRVLPEPNVPASWQDPVRMIRTILDLWVIDPQSAEEVHRFATEKLVAVSMRNGG